MRYLGRKSELTATLRSIGELPPEQRGPVGKQANEVRQALEALLAERTDGARGAELDRRLAEDRIDVTLPGDPPRPAGHLHLVSQIRREMEDIFVGLGFSVLEGPEIEYDYYNFTALNHPPEHPARLPQDTFYLAEQRAAAHAHLADAGARDGGAGAADLHRRARARVPARHARRHARADVPPARGARDRRGHHARRPPGRAARSSPARCSARTREVRLRPGYFPFTEPSVEVDVSCFRCGGTGWEGSQRCGTCKGEAWIEILGSGMVDPNVLDYVEDSGYDNERVQGFAFGMGIERIASIVLRGARTCACSSTTTCACWSSSGPAHEGPGRLAALVLRPRHAAPRRSPTP